VARGGAASKLNRTASQPQMNADGHRKLACFYVISKAVVYQPPRINLRPSASICGQKAPPSGMGAFSIYSGLRTGRTVDLASGPGEILQKATEITKSQAADEEAPCRESQGSICGT
jgi:hypothetical protein